MLAHLRARMPEHLEVTRSPAIGVRYHRWLMAVILAHGGIIAAFQPSPRAQRAPGKVA
jgi:hypothetical protein